jgi:aminopeptidase-like protein
MPAGRSAMILDALRQPAAQRALADDLATWMAALHPLTRSLTGDGVRRSFDLIADAIGGSAPLVRHEIPTGTALYDWQVPDEWTIGDAFIADVEGRRLVDIRRHNLHVVNASAPVRGRFSRDALEPHLHSLPDAPDLIPYRTSYWRRDWGFCLSQRQRDGLGPGPFDVCIDSTLASGHLSLAECIVPGRGDGIGLVYTHTCHPSLANDNLSGMVAATALARALRREEPRLTWHIVFGPGTLGSLAWLSLHEADLPRVEAGFTLGLVGDTAPITWKRSRRGDTAADRVAAFVLGRGDIAHRLHDFEPYGYDERQFCSPGFDLPVGRLSRARHSEYAGYHTSGDDLASVSPERVAQVIAVAADIIGTLDANRRFVNQSPRGEPRLGKRGLYGSLGGRSPRDSEMALLWVLSGSDGRQDLVAIAERSKLPFGLIAEAAEALEQVDLLRVAGACPPARKDSP